METFYGILEKFWGGQAGSQHDADGDISSDGGDDGDDGDGGDGGDDGFSPIEVNIVEPPATQPDPEPESEYPSSTGTPEMPPPPIPSKDSNSLPSQSSSGSSAGGVLDPQLRETALRRIAALKTLRKITLNQLVKCILFHVSSYPCFFQPKSQTPKSA